MAIVGPRPTIAEQVAEYTPEQRRRLEVKPGLTGWAQVNGRASLPWEERIELDVWYVDNRSARLDAADHRPHDRPAAHRPGPVRGMSVRLLTTADADAWNAALPAERSVFGSLGFARAQERAGAGRAGCWSPTEWRIRCGSGGSPMTCRSRRQSARRSGTRPRLRSPDLW